MFNGISLPFGLRLCELQPQDQVFAEALFFSTREFLYQMPLAKPQVDLLIKQQFMLQQASYSTSFPTAETFIVNIFAEPIGKLVLNNTSDSLHIIDIAFIPSMRNKGYGTSILRALKRLADQTHRPVRLAVDQQNPRAKKLYLSLGFTLLDSSTTHDTLVW
ncbi:GNAT family N-acetyltransferase [Cellvibrio sp. OA-2007]|uniref:GNAT family N-acetyltransferase n=1 Tax=Cellvibrio sp. OA-2007 TaxID=529823 RepID=UPI0007808968|nr:GNAT family N-acetyltransferase [Cellvibrio sp. OA-2007]